MPPVRVRVEVTHQTTESAWIETYIDPNAETPAQAALAFVEAAYQDPDDQGADIEWHVDVEVNGDDYVSQDHYYILDKTTGKWLHVNRSPHANMVLCCNDDNPPAEAFTTDDGTVWPLCQACVATFPEPAPAAVPVIMCCMHPDVPATHVFRDEDGNEHGLCDRCAEAFNWGTEYPGETAEPIIDCPQCHEHVTGADATSVADRGYCLECHTAWQHGELDEDDKDTIDTDHVNCPYPDIACPDDCKAC